MCVCVCVCVYVCVYIIGPRYLHRIDSRTHLPSPSMDTKIHRCPNLLYKRHSTVGPPNPWMKRADYVCLKKKKLYMF